MKRTLVRSTPLFNAVTTKTKRRLPAILPVFMLVIFAFLASTSAASDSVHLQPSADISSPGGETVETGHFDVMPEQPASTALYGSISGTVTDETSGAPLEGIRVFCIYFDISSWRECGEPFTDANGNYRLDNLVPANHRLWFFDPNENYISEYYNDKAGFDNADDIFVPAFGTVTGIDAALLELGHITGAVTAAATGAPLEDIEVCVGGYAHGGWYCEYTDAEGDYDIGRLATDDYLVQFQDYSGIYQTEYYDDAVDSFDADLVPVIVGSTTAGINTVLVEPGHISGKLTAEVGGWPLEGIEVGVYEYDGSWNWIKSGWSDDEGNYDIGGLDAGPHRVTFYDPDGIYVSEWYDDTPDINSATDIIVPTVVGIDAELALSVELEGLTLDGLDNHVILPQDFPAVTDFTFAAWIYWNGVGHWWQRIFDFGQNTTHNMFLTPNSDYGTMRFAITTSGAGGEEQLDASAWLPASGWHHVAVTLEGDTGKLYLDGREEASGPITLDPVQVTGANNWLGRSHYAHDPYLDGKIDEVAIFDRALSQSEIQSVIVGGWDGLPGMVMGLHMDEDPAPHGTILSDGSGLDNLGTVYRYHEVTQDIPLLAGWNMISSCVDPQNPDLAALLAPIESDIVLLKNGAGQVYWPAQVIDDIGSWEIRDGYQIYMDNPAGLSLTGSEADPAQMPLDLLIGWSLITYPRVTPMPVDQALNTISSELVLVKNGLGQVYWPAYGVNQIGDLVPGEGYQVYLQSPGTLTYPAN